MSRKLRRYLPAAGGLLVGLCLGLAVTVGVLLNRTGPTAGFLDEMKLKAVASSSCETFAIATGHIDEEVEGLFCLDFVTGDLSCYILSPRNGAPSGYFKTNIAEDLPIEKGKKPAYAIATGNFQARATTGQSKPANSIVYVADSNTGNVAGYTFLWNRSASAADYSQASPMKRVFFAKARAAAVRE